MLGTIVCAGLVAGAAYGQSFEVASIKQHVLPPGMVVFRSSNSNAIRISGNRVTIRMASLAALVGAAYGANDYQVSGGPGWAADRGGDVWDIDAKADGDGAIGMEQARVLLQNLLAERFHLKLRHEPKEIAVYNLVVAKGGAKLKQVPEGTPRDAQTAPMAQIVTLAGIGLDRPLIDKTGLAGTYQFNWNLGQMDLDRSKAPDQIGKVGVVLTSIEDALGLKAEAAKVMMDTLVIESAEKPTEN